MNFSKLSGQAEAAPERGRPGHVPDELWVPKPFEALSSFQSSLELSAAFSGLHLHFEITDSDFERLVRPAPAFFFVFGNDSQFLLVAFISIKLIADLMCQWIERIIIINLIIWIWIIYWLLGFEFGSECITLMALFILFKHIFMYVFFYYFAANTEALFLYKSYFYNI